MAGNLLDYTEEGLFDLSPVSSHYQLPPHLPYLTNSPWSLPLPLEQSMSAHSHPHHSHSASLSHSPTIRGTISPLQTSGHALHGQNNGSINSINHFNMNNAGHIHQQSLSHNSANVIMREWPGVQQQSAAPQLQFAQDNGGMATQLSNPFVVPFHASPIDFIASQPVSMDTGMMSNSYVSMNPLSADSLAWNWQELQSGLRILAGQEDRADVGWSQTSQYGASPTETYLEEVRSLHSSGSENEWTVVNSFPSFDTYADAVISNPAQNLQRHSATGGSVSSQSEEMISNPSNSRASMDFEEIFHQTLNSPDSDGFTDHSFHSFHHRNQHTHDFHDLRTPEIDFIDRRDYPALSPKLATPPEPLHIAISPKPSINTSPTSQTSPLTQTSPISQASTSPVSRKASRGSRKSPIAKSTKPVIRRPSHNAKKDPTEKRIGRRKGPLLPEQRKQASEIRKLRACLRCKFLKKTCDPGEPCNGCQPSHARLWQVPCTRIDIKDIGYFMKDWKADFERHVNIGLSAANIHGFSSAEKKLYITHGYGWVLPVTAREVFVRDEDCFTVDWTESDHETPLEFAVQTDKLSAGSEGIPHSLLSEYLDQHIDGRTEAGESAFECFVDEYFEGTKFLTEILKTAHRYYLRESLPVMRKALKLVLAYNLTMHVTLVEGLAEEETMVGKIDDETSKFNGKTLAPVIINFQVKVALAKMWRELQKEILEELSTLYSSVYSGDKLKNWPTIFMLASILLAVWEEMQFDCHYRVPDQAAVAKFCSDMETTPVGVIVGLFAAISTKLPAFNEWDTQKHHHLLNSNMAVCDAMTEVRSHVAKHEAYLKSRADCKFDRTDFDSLSNKFLSKLVIRAN
ncbi:MAG: hypothetical protein M1829_006479 [Trizodia sp. TS-e1964]|nr:MAG: hypothetical protein M1829_006479 [Trizodia sp. TS-e1964]